MTDLWAASPLAHAIAAALVASIWQGAAVALGTAVALRAMRGSSPHARYLVSCAALLLLAGCWTATAIRHGALVFGGDSRVAVVAAAQPDTPRTSLQSTEIAASPDTHRVGVQASVTSAASSDFWRMRLDAWSIALVPLWALGVCICSARLALAWACLRRVRRAPLGALPPVLLSRLQGVVTAVGVRGPLRIAQSAAVHVPTVVGWLRPIVLLPASALAGLTPRQLEAIVAHELAHIRRHDFVMNLLQSAIEVLLFYHPVCWWLSRQIRETREQCCDDIAVAACGDAHAYARALATLEEVRTDGIALSLAATDGPLLRRIRRVIAPRASDDGSTPARVAAVLPVAIAVALLMAPAVGPSADAAAATTRLPGTLSASQVRPLPLAGPAPVSPAQSAAPSAGRQIPQDRGVVDGQVIDELTARPIADAKVELAGPARAVVVATDENGRYHGEGLEPGNYRVSVRANGYVARAYGATDRNTIGTLVQVDGGQLVSRVDVRLQAAAAVSGRILDERGDTLKGIEVELLTERAIGGRRQPFAIGFAQSDENGEYRFKDVLPGVYWVRAYQADYDDRSVHAALTAAACRFDPDNCNRVRRSTFYPSAPNAEEAQLLHVYSGQELFGTDVTLLNAKPRRVAGRLVSPTGNYSGLEVHLMPKGPTGGSSDRYGASPKASGEFEIAGVVPGTYMLMVFARESPLTWLPTTQDVVVEDEDVTGLVLVGQRTGRVEGHIGADPSVTSKVALSGVRVAFEMPLGAGGIRIAGGPQVAPDGSFSGDAPAGPVRIRVSGLPQGWMVRTITVDGSDVAANGLATFAEAARHRVDVLLTNRVTRVVGQVVDKDGRSIPDAVVVVFADDPARWDLERGGVQPLNVRRNGSFDVEGLSPGDYLAADATGLPSGAMSDPEVLKQLSATATRFRLREGEERSIRVVGGGR